MTAPTGQFTFTRLERIVFGPGRIAALGDELVRHGVERAIVVTGRTLGASRLLDQVTGAMGGRCAAVFAGAGQHVPAASVRALVDEMTRVGADGIVSFGGGSPIDTAKVAAASMMSGRDMTREGGELDFDKAMAGGGGGFVHIAVPTTLSAGEFTPAGGVTDEATRVKRGVIDPRLQPRSIIHDPALTLETPDWLWVATGMRALDHAVEALYSTRAQTFTDTLASKAIRLLVQHLPASIATTGDASLEHRGYCQTAAWFSLFGGINTRLGISHALGHKIGPRWNVPHGVTSCITLPHAMRFMAGVAPERFEGIAEGLGVVFDPANPVPGALASAERVAEFIAGFDVPHSLEAAGVPHGEIRGIAETIHHEIALAGVVQRAVTVAEVEGLLEAAYP